VLKNSASDQPQWIGETNLADPVIYGPAFSTYVRSVLLALEEKGVPYHLEQINILEGAHQTPEHRARHPFAKVPAFEHDGFELYETLAILRYVDETFDGPSLQPDDPRARARMTQVLAIVDAYAYPVCIGACVIQRLVVPLMGGTPDEDVVAAAVPQATTSVEALEALIDGNAFFAGDKLSLADLHVAPIYDYFSQTPEGERALAGTPNLRRWWDAVSQRESVQKTRPALG
jgi:glutathione S-transferase